MRISPRYLALGAVGVWIAAPGLSAQEVRRALPVNPPTAPAVPFDFDKTTPTPAPAPTPKATPAIAAPTPIPVTTPFLAATPAPAATPMPTAPLITSEPADVQQIEYANNFYSKKIYDMAAPEYEKYINDYPQGASLQMAYFRLAESYRGLGSTNSAKTTYEKLLDNFTTGDFVGPAAYRLGDLYFQDKNYDLALPMFRRAAVRLTDKTEVNAAKYFAARCLENTQSPAGAIQAYEEVAETKDNNPFREASRLSLAQLLTDSGKKVEAHKQYELLAQETDKPDIRMEALVKASLLKIDLGEYEKAASDLQKALQQPQIGQWKEVARVGLMNAWYESGKYKDVTDFYAANGKDFSTDALPEVLLLAGNAQRKLGNYKDSLPLYSQVIDKDPDSSFAKEAQYQRLASLYYADDAGLAAEIDKYLAQNPTSDKSSQLTLMKAESLYRKQKYAEAAPVYASLAGSTLPDDLMADAEFKLGWCQMQTKNFPDAIKSFSQFLASYPKNKLVASALAQRALAYQQTKDLASALKDFNHLIGDYPKAKEREIALEQKALILGQQQDNQGMSDTFKKLLKEYPDSEAAPKANYWIGWAAFTAKDYKDAVTPFETARKGDKEKYFDMATLYIMNCYLYLEQRDKLAAEVEAYPKEGVKIKIPVQVLRWLGAQYLEAKNYDQSEKFLKMVTDRKDEIVPDDWLNLGRSFSGQHRSVEAVQAFKTYLDGAKEPVPRAVGLLALGDAQLSLGNYDDAQKSVEEECVLQPEGKMNAEGRILEGEIQDARGNYDDAAKLFQRVVILMDDPAITPRAMELAIASLKKAGKDAEAAKMLNDLQTRYGEYLQQKSGAGGN
ncbi:MAG TPA: tetratricopeptide repeat protein [Chthoniobacteraceae bacterium]|nr:tetratricopeptide repeat protein [Chthoniobacteraceae bacterium]